MCYCKEVWQTGRALLRSARKATCKLKARSAAIRRPKLWRAAAKSCKQECQECTWLDIILTMLQKALQVQYQRRKQNLINDETFRNKLQYTYNECRGIQSNHLYIVEQNWQQKNVHTNLRQCFWDVHGDSWTWIKHRAKFYHQHAEYSSGLNNLHTRHIKFSHGCPPSILFAKANKQFLKTVNLNTSSGGDS